MCICVIPLCSLFGFSVQAVFLQCSLNVYEDCGCPDPRPSPKNVQRMLYPEPHEVRVLSHHQISE